jgi:hypothetical protein
MQNSIHGRCQNEVPLALCANVGTKKNPICLNAILSAFRQMGVFTYN